MQQHAHSHAPLVQGDVINDKYVLERVIARGGVSVVWLARHLRPEECPGEQPYFALKVLNGNLTWRADVAEALEREARKAQSLIHPNIVDVWSFERAGNDYFITMECLLGDTLDEFIKRHAKGGIGKAKALEIIAKLAAGLSYAHAQRVVHSDFKPANVFVTKDGEIKILDFGVARAVQTGGRPAVYDSATFGAYASCELLYGAEPNVANDVYGLACVAYELLAGRHPFDKKSAATALQDGLTPPAVKGLTRSQNKALRHALALREEDRTPSVNQFLAEMNQRGRSPVPIYTALLLLLVIAAVGVIWPQKFDDFKQWVGTSLFKGDPAAQIRNNDAETFAAGGVSQRDAANAGEFAAGRRDARADGQTADFDGGRPGQDPRAQQIAELRANFDQAIGQPVFELETAQRLLGDLDTLSDLGEPFPNGKYIVVERLIQQVNALDEQGATAEAINLVVLIRGLVMDSVELQNLESRLNAKNRAVPQNNVALVQKDDAVAQDDDALLQNDDAIAQSDEAIAQNDDAIAQSDDATVQSDDAIAQSDNSQRLLSAQQQLRDLLAAPVFDSAWDAQLQQRFTELKDSGASDPTVTDFARAISQAYLNEARRERIEDRAYADAERDLAQAKRYDPQTPGLALEEVAVSAALAAMTSLRLDAERSPVAVPATATATAPAPAPATVPAPAPDAPGAEAYDVCSRSSLIGNGALPGRFCNDLLQDGTEGPILVVVPAGGPLTAPLAIGKYEISVESYNQYCKAAPACAPNGAANDLYYPVTGITIAQAEAYINWLSKQTGQTYRLPTNNEWEYAAAARDKWPDRNRNCQANAGADSTGGSPSLSAVNAGGTVNAWGLFHHLDNVREWVLAGKDIYVRGGSYIDAIDDCSIRLSEPHAGQADPYTGFRIVREIRK